MHIVAIMLSDIQHMLIENAGAEFALKMKTIDAGANRIYGVLMPILNTIAKTTSAEGCELIAQLWEAGAYEDRILGAKMLNKFA